MEGRREPTEGQRGRGDEGKTVFGTMSSCDGEGNVRAACVTPPGAGGIAVIQVVGRRAAALLGGFLKSNRPIDLKHMDANQVRLCRWVDGDQVLDDALVTVRVGPGGETIVDVSLHGGPRIVQRALVMLKRAGARIVEPIELVDQSWPTAHRVERELLPLLLRAQTRAVASWLAEMVNRLPAEIAGIVHEIRADHLHAARASLGALCRNAARRRYLLDGVRVVLVGEPNVGKSTLANALAGREHAVVSDIPGTTRDWVEHRGAVDGVPFVFVDTAGIREARDLVEAEAIRRTREQMAPADILLRVIDVSAPPTPVDLDAVAAQNERERRDQPGPRHQEHRPREQTSPCHLFVWNKSDLPPDPGHTELISRTGDAGTVVSARTEAGLAELRRALAQAVGLTDWQQEVAPVTERQVTACHRALSALTADVADRAGALTEFEGLVHDGFSAEGRPRRGYN